jgi:hypothetical protein
MAIRYVGRVNGQIEGGDFANPQPGLAEEAIDENDAELIAARARWEALPAKIAAGIAITSTGTPAISATYALDQVTLDQIGAVARDAGAGLGLPGGLPTFTYPDIEGEPQTLSQANVIALYKAMRDLLFALNTTAATLAAGGDADWPVQSVTIP